MTDKREAEPEDAIRRYIANQLEKSPNITLENITFLNAFKDHAVATFRPVDLFKVSAIKEYGLDHSYSEPEAIEYYPQRKVKLTFKYGSTELQLEDTDLESILYRLGRFLAVEYVPPHE